MELSADEIKERQKEHSDEAYKSRFRNGWQSLKESLIGDFINYYPLKKAISLLPFLLKGKTVLNVCCGDGFEAEYLVKLGAEVTVLDISSEAVKAAKRRCPQVKGVVADAENLPFKDKNFDLVIVRAGFHHLPHPHKGIAEMARVSRMGFIFIEAQKNFITKILINLGLAEEYEESGNYVYRFARKEIHTLMQRLGVRNYTIETIWCRYAAFLHKGVYSYFNNKFWLVIFELPFFSFNAFFGYWGNTIIVVAVKP